MLVIGAELLTRFLDYTDRSTCILFGDGAGAVVLSASDEPGGGLGIEMTTEPQGAYMIWLPGRWREEPAVGRDHRPRRALHPDGGQGDLPVRDADAGVDRARGDPARPACEPADIDLFIPHQANIRIIEAVAKGLDLPMERMFVNLDKYGNTSAASVPIALAEAVNEGRVKVGDRIVIVAFGAGFTSGAVAIEWTADPARGIAGDAAVDPADVHVRLPVDWDSVDPIPAALAEIVARPVAPGVDVPLDDVVPGEPEPPMPARRSTHDRSVRQDGARHRRLARDRAGHRAAARDAGRGRRVHLPRQRRGRGRDDRRRSRRSAGARSRSRATPGRPRPPRASSRPRSRRSARSTSSSTTRASPATT